MNFIRKKSVVFACFHSIVVRALAFHADDPGSIHDMKNLFRYFMSKLNWTAVTHYVLFITQSEKSEYNIIA